MKVSTLDEEKVYEIPDKDMTIREVVVSFVCPICQGNAYKMEPDLWQCSKCHVLWSVE